MVNGDIAFFRVVFFLFPENRFRGRGGPWMAAAPSRKFCVYEEENYEKENDRFDYVRFNGSILKRVRRQQHR